MSTAGLCAVPLQHRVQKLTMLPFMTFSFIARTSSVIMVNIVIYPTVVLLCASCNPASYARPGLVRRKHRRQNRYFIWYLSLRPPRCYRSTRPDGLLNIFNTLVDHKSSVGPSPGTRDLHFLLGVIFVGLVTEWRLRLCGR